MPAEDDEGDARRLVLPALTAGVTGALAAARGVPALAVAHYALLAGIGAFGLLWLLPAGRLAARRARASVLPGRRDRRRRSVS